MTFRSNKSGRSTSTPTSRTHRRYPPKVGIHGSSAAPVPKIAAARLAFGHDPSAVASRRTALRRSAVRRRRRRAPRRSFIQVRQRRTALLVYSATMAAVSPWNFSQGSASRSMSSFHTSTRPTNSGTLTRVRSGGGYSRPSTNVNALDGEQREETRILVWLDRADELVNAGDLRLVGVLEIGAAEAAGVLVNERLASSSRAGIGGLRGGSTRTFLAGLCSAAEPDADEPPAPPESPKSTFCASAASAGMFGGRGL